VDGEKLLIKMKCTLVFLLFLFGCSDLVKPEIITSSIRVPSSQCGSTAASRIELKQLGERLWASALLQITPQEIVIVTFFSSPSGDWTVMIDGRNGISCMVLWGKHWSRTGQES
jgi:hypothetical protein